METNEGEGRREQIRRTDKRALRRLRDPMSFHNASLPRGRRPMCNRLTLKESLPLPLIPLSKSTHSSHLQPGFKDFLHSTSGGEEGEEGSDEWKQEKGEGEAT